MSETNFRQFIASSELFSGYEVMIDLNECNSIDDIVNTFYDNLYNCLTLHKFRILLEEVKECKLHIHSYTFEDILTSAGDSVFYVCDHC
jgi:hypothetical protein